MSFQKCPICNGTGQDHLSSITSQIPNCPVCKGARIINEQTGMPPKSVSINNRDHLYGMIEKLPDGKWIEELGKK